MRGRRPAIARPRRGGRPSAEQHPLGLHALRPERLDRRTGKFFERDGHGWKGPKGLQKE